jgi:hypothetical protein
VALSRRALANPLSEQAAGDLFANMNKTLAWLIAAPLWATVRRNWLVWQGGE